MHQRSALNGQSLAAFGPTCIDNSSSTACFHTRKKAMRSGTSHFGGLVSTFHFSSPLICDFLHRPDERTNLLIRKCCMVISLDNLGNQ